MMIAPDHRLLLALQSARNCLPLTLMSTYRIQMIRRIQGPHIQRRPKHLEWGRLLGVNQP